MYSLAEGLYPRPTASYAVCVTAQVAKHAADMVLANDDFITIGESATLHCIASPSFAEMNVLFVCLVDWELLTGYVCLCFYLPQWQLWLKGDASMQIPSSSSDIWSAVT
jgi:hypothetical protein